MWVRPAPSAKLIDASGRATANRCASAASSAGRPPSRAPFPANPGPSKKLGSPSKRGSERKPHSPACPARPVPSGAWRSTFDPSFVLESFTCRQRRRSRPTTESQSSITCARPVGGSHVEAAGQQVAGVQADAQPLLAAPQLDQLGQLLEAPARAWRRCRRCPPGAARSPRFRPEPHGGPSRSASSPVPCRPSAPSPRGAPRRPRRWRRPCAARV